MSLLVDLIAEIIGSLVLPESVRGLVATSGLAELGLTLATGCLLTTSSEAPNEPLGLSILVRSVVVGAAARRLQSGR